jgi:hypothetical protein
MHGQATERSGQFVRQLLPVDPRRRRQPGKFIEPALGVCPEHRLAGAFMGPEPHRPVDAVVPSRAEVRPPPVEAASLAQPQPVFQLHRALRAGFPGRSRRRQVQHKDDLDAFHRVAPCSTSRTRRSPGGTDPREASP